MKRKYLWLTLLVVAGLPLALFPAFVDVGSCVQLARSGLRPIAESREKRFLGKVQEYTARCRGGDQAAQLRVTPWVDWTNYFGTGDESSLSQVAPVLIERLGPNSRGIDGALLDLEYQRIELIKFNLFDNATFEDYVKGRNNAPGRAVRVWQAMRLPTDHPQFQAVGGTGEQLCRGDLIRARTLTGICNDIKNPLMGSTKTQFARNVQFEETFPQLGKTELIRNRHGDRLGLLQPDPQLISRKLFTRQQSQPERCNLGQGLPDASTDAECDYVKAPFFNVLAAYWIQFMTHDWFSHLEEGQNARAPLMEVGCKDSQAVALGCRPDDRVDPALVAQEGPAPTFTHEGKEYMSRAHKTFSNNVTAWWDASQIYGYDETSARRVKRDPSDPAKLLMVQLRGRADTGDEQGYLPQLQATDPMNPAWSGQEAVAFPDNWSIGMSFYHNVFVREHNAFVTEFRNRVARVPDEDSGLRNPAFPDRVIRYRDVTSDELYQAARLVVAAEIAKIHTIEWTTQLLYDEVLYKGMNANWHGLFKGKDHLARAANRITVDEFGNTLDEAGATQWYSVFASGAGIFGLGNKRYDAPAGLFGFLRDKKDIWNIANPDHVNGGVNHFGSPFNFPEEFVTVYRLHPLVPDLLEFRQVSEPNAIQKKIPVINTFRGKATAAMDDGGLSNWALTMGRQRLGALSLQNHPQFLQNLPMPRLNTKTNMIDVVALDIIRDRERGVPRFNEFRRQYGLKSLSSFDDFVDVRLPAGSEDRRKQEELVKSLRAVYGTHVCDASKIITTSQVNADNSPINDCLGRPTGSVVDNVEDVDVVVGWLAESTRPHGFAISETQFTVFILNASRRLFSDRFFTSSFRPEFYSQLGVEWVNDNGPGGKVTERRASNGHEDEVAPLKRILLRTMPELAPELNHVTNTFDPWARDRGDYYSLQWKARSGAEDDPAFK
jgi:hypothetical protein